MKKNLFVLAMFFLAAVSFSCGGGGGGGGAADSGASNTGTSSGSGGGEGNKASSPPITSAQPYTYGVGGLNEISGTVYLWYPQAAMALPLPNAVVSIDGTDLKATTDGNGNYVLSNPPAQKFTARVLGPGGESLYRFFSGGSEINWVVVLGSYDPILDFEGIISDRATEKGIKGAKVTFGQTGIVAFTSFGGQFLISQPPRIKTMVIVEKEGYMIEKIEFDFFHTGYRLTLKLSLRKIS